MFFFCYVLVFVGVLVLPTTIAGLEYPSQNDSSNNNASSSSSIPNWWGCQDEVSQSFQYCNTSLSHGDRLEALLSLLTLDEKIQQLTHDPNLTVPCHTISKGVARVGLPPYLWLAEANTVVNSACMAPGHCATQFTGPLSMAASFNRTSWYLKGSVLGTEQRALVNIHGQRNTPQSGVYLGLTAFGPNINQQRDPRFGRTSELPGEDPFLAGQYAIHMVQGMQEQDAAGYPKVLAYLKHFAAYSRETNRGHDNYEISLHDLFDTYLAQYEMAMTEGNATGVMCSYNGINGRPSCANDWLLNTILRKQWNRPMAHVTTDCGAVTNLLGAPVHAPDNESAAAFAINNGTDIEMGTLLFSSSLHSAIDHNLTTEAAIDQSFRRSYLPQFRLGRFDPPSASEWSRFGLQDINSTSHQQIQLEAALQGLVLLKNGDNVLPLSSMTQSKIAVLGPLGHTRAGLMSDYENDQPCFGGGHDCIPTLAESIQKVGGKGSIISAMGVDVDSNRTNGIEEAVQLAKEADVIVLCLGITKDQEREAKDRVDTALPGLQETFALQILNIGKPVVLVLVNGGQVAIDNLVKPSAAIIEAFNPNGIGGTALALSLFGKQNRWGKLPYTLYKYADMQAMDMVSHDMSGRTYRYFKGTPVFPFGYGLSLTRFEATCHQKKTIDESLQFSCLVSNVGQWDGDEVIQVYHSLGKDIRESIDHPAPTKALVDFARVTVPRGKQIETQFMFPSPQDLFAVVNAKGERTTYAGMHKLIFTNGAHFSTYFWFSRGQNESAVDRTVSGTVHSTVATAH